MSAVRDAALRDAFVAPDGSAWIYASEEGLCVARHDQPDVEPTCAAWDGLLPLQGVSWSSDVTRVTFTQDFFRSRQEPDVMVFDIAEGRIDVLTDDAVDDINDDSADIDLSPFFGPGDEIYFFRYSRSERTDALFRIVGDNAESVDGGQMSSGRSPGAPPIPAGENSWAQMYFDGGVVPGYSLLTFDGSNGAAALEDLWSPPVESGPAPIMVDAGGGRLLIVPQDSRYDDTQPFVVIPEEQKKIELPIDEDPLYTWAIALSPDGETVLEVGGSSGEGVAQFTVWQLDDEGGDVTAKPTQIGTVTDERIGPGLGVLPGTLGWDGGTTITAIGPDGAVTFDVTTE